MAYSLQGDGILLHGPPKIGKTQLADSFPTPLVFLAGERGQGYIRESNKKLLIPINNADDFGKVTTRLPKIKPKTVVIDTIAAIYQYHFVAVCDRHGCDHPHDKGEFGRMMWSQIANLFIKNLSKLVALCSDKNVTLVIIDHTKEETVETVTGSVTKVMCGMAGQARRFVAPIPDHTWFMGYGDEGSQEDESDAKDIMANFKDQRALWLRGGLTIEAGCRDKNMLHKLIFPLEEADHKKKKGGYYQIIKEMGR